MFYKFTTNQLLVLSLHASNIVDDIVTREEDEERHLAIQMEFIRPFQYPYLVAYEAKLEGLSVEKYCIKRLKAMGVKGRHITAMKRISFR